MIEGIIHLPPMVQDELSKEIILCMSDTLWGCAFDHILSPSLCLRLSSPLPHFFPAVYPSLVSLRLVHTSLPPPFIAVFGDKPPLVGQ